MPPLVVAFLLAGFPFFSFYGGVFAEKAFGKREILPSDFPVRRFFLFFLRWGVFVRFSCFFTKKEAENGSFV